MSDGAVLGVALALLVLVWVAIPKWIKSRRSK
jgi:hypothetical protein